MIYPSCPVHSDMDRKLNEKSLKFIPVASGSDKMGEFFKQVVLWFNHTIEVVHVSNLVYP